MLRLGNELFTTTGLKSKLDEYINGGEHEKVLLTIGVLVELLFCDQQNVAKLFGHSMLDDYCQKVGARIEAEHETSSERRTELTSATVTFIVSRLQVSGGHTAVLLDFIGILVEKYAVSVIITGVGGVTEPGVFEILCNKFPQVKVSVIKEKSLVSKVIAIQKTIAYTSPYCVYVFSHHQDSVAIASVQPHQGYVVKFVHHADHHLSLGVFLPWVQHIDLHPNGYHTCRELLGISNKYYPMMVDDRHVVERITNSRNNVFITCTAARSNKVEVPYVFPYVDVVPELLNVTKGIHVHIGIISARAQSRIRKRLDVLGIKQSSFVYIDQVTSVWDTLLEYNVDLYLGSFPYGGARTLIEVMGAGVPAAVHMHSTSRMLGTHDMIYPGAIFWKTPDELFTKIKKIDTAFLDKQRIMARLHYEQYHSREMLSDVILNEAQVAPKLLKDDYTSDLFESALGALRDEKLKRLLLNWFYVRFRIFRSFKVLYI
ncbi:MAG: hypothetical protein H7A00_00095 [Hahellaceae bacterium]|nr:hypothetical protein [Hahellaceae bacterium]